MFLKNVETWKKSGKEVDQIHQKSPEEFEEVYQSGNPIVFDVRKKSEYDSEHVVKAVNIPLNQINEHLAQFPKDKAFYIHCAGGYRSMIAASILKSRGWDRFIDLKHGFKGIKENTKVKLTEYTAPTTML